MIKKKLNKILESLTSIVRLSAFLSLTTIAIQVAILFAVFPENIRYKNRLFFSFCSFYSWLSLKFLGFKVNYAGSVPDDGPFIIVANHSSLADPLFIEALMSERPRVWFFKHTLLRMPFIGWFLSRMFIPVDRKSQSGSARALIKSIRLCKKQNSSLIIFPEGTRHKDDVIHQFKPGFARASKLTGFPVLPIFIKNSHTLLSKGILLNNLRKEITVTVGSTMRMKAGETEALFAERVKECFVKNNANDKL